MKKITLLLFFIISTAVVAQTARVQIIHNSPDHTLEALDVYFGNQKVVDSIPFRYSTDYRDAPANTPIVMALQSPGQQDTLGSLFRKTISFDPDSTYVLIISGLISTLPYDSLKPLEVRIHKSRESSRVAGKVDVLFFNGGTDAPGILIDELTVPNPNFLPLLRYGAFSAYKEVTNQNYEFRVIDNNTKQTIAPYFANFGTIGLADSAVVIVTSGLIDTSQSVPGDSTSSINAPLFGLYMALPGGGPLIELPAKSGIGLEEALQTKVLLYPNPANNVIEMVFPEEINGAIDVAILDMNGKPVIEETLYNHSTQIHKVRVSSLKVGYYLLEAKAGNNWFYSTKVLIE